MRTTTPKTPVDYGPQQFPTHLCIELWRFERALRLGLIPVADPATGRWAAAVVDRATEQLDQIRAATGAHPDMGAHNAAALLADRFGIEVSPDTLVELARQDLIPMAGDFKGYPLYCGQALESFQDRDALVTAQIIGRQRTRAETAAYLKIRSTDLERLIRAHWLEPVAWVRSGHRSRSGPADTPLFRTGDLDVLRTHPAIDWDAVRSTPRGRTSPLALITPKPAAT